MDLELSGRVAVVTGGSRGIGRAIARELAMEGADVAIVARGEDALARTAEELGMETRRRVVPIVADTADVDSVRAMVARVHEIFGRIDILVNNAATPGGGAPPSLSELTQTHFDSDMNVKVMGYLRCAQAVAPIMQSGGWGRIINIAGLSSRVAGSIMGSMRNVSVAAMTKNLASMLGPYGINVTVVHPGATRTERTAATIAQQASDRGIPEVEIERELSSASSIGRLVSAQEVAWVVTFLASPRSISINGDAVTVGGGFGNAIHY